MSEPHSPNAASTPAVTVIMPVYNCGGYIEEAVQSVGRQSEPDFELVVVDDGSTDETGPILSRLAHADRRIRLLRQPNSGKPAVARNRALREARGRFISFLDGDDLYHPDKLRRELDVFRSYPDVDVVFADLQKFSDTPRTDGSGGWLHGDRFLARAGRWLRSQERGMYLAEPGFYHFMTSEMTAINTQTAMVRRTVGDAQPYWFDEDILIGEDADLFFRLARRCRVAFIDEVLAYYRQRPGSLTQWHAERLRSELRVHSRNLEYARPMLSRRELTRARQQLAWRFHALGYQEYAAWNRTAARRAYLQAIGWETRLGERLVILADLAKTWLPAGLIEWKRRHSRRAGGNRAGELAA